MVMRLPSKVGMLSARPNSSSSTAKRRSCFSPCWANWMERPRKKMEALTLDQELLGVLELELEVVLVRVGAEADFLDDNLRSVGFHLLRFLALLVKVLLVVQNLAYGRIGLGGDFHQVQFLLLRHGQGLGEGVDTLFGDVFPYQSYL